MNLLLAVLKLCKFMAWSHICVLCHSYTVSLNVNLMVIQTDKTQNLFHFFSFFTFTHLLSGKSTYLRVINVQVLSKQSPTPSHHNFHHPTLLPSFPPSSLPLPPSLSKRYEIKIYNYSWSPVYYNDVVFLEKKLCPTFCHLTQEYSEVGYSAQLRDDFKMFFLLQLCIAYTSIVSSYGFVVGK